MIRTKHTYIYINRGGERNIDGVGMVTEGEQIAIPYTPINDPLLEQVEVLSEEELVEDESDNTDESESSENVVA